ncbi:MAG: HEAT repeat domain-containing protein [Solirubrobacteraceae bacterium]|nr:HEAT repeat domain-containing protein [Solirubrobacteraceae bacterium]
MPKSDHADPEVEGQAYRDLFEARLERDAAGLVALAVNQDAPHLVRIGALWKLGKLGDAKVLPQLIAVMEDEDPELRVAAFCAIDGIDDPRATDVLRSALADRDPIVVSWSVAYLARRRELSTTQAVALLEHDDLIVRRAAVAALRRGGDRSARSPLRRLAAREHGLAKAAAITASIAVARRQPT